MTADDLREIALAMPGATQRSHMGHHDFRAGGPEAYPASARLAL